MVVVQNIPRSWFGASVDMLFQAEAAGIQEVRGMLHLAPPVSLKKPGSPKL